MASDGKDVDIDVGELRYGEKKDLIVEVEMEVEAPAESERQPTFSSATDEYFMKVGLDPLALGDASSFYDGEHETLSTDTPLFEVCSFLLCVPSPPLPSPPRLCERPRTDCDAYPFSFH